MSSIVEGRPPAIDAVTAANWTAAGICAHESAVKAGREVEIPGFARAGVAGRLKPAGFYKVTP